MVPPFYENLGKRLTKSPKIFFLDSGLACHLLGIDTPEELAKSPFRGALFEGFIGAELVKAQVSAGRRRELYYFRDEQGLEVDYLLPTPGGGLRMIECKASRTVFPGMATPLVRLAQALRQRRRSDFPVELYLVHEAPRAGGATTALAPGVRALPWQPFLEGE